MIKNLKRLFVSISLILFSLLLPSVNFASEFSENPVCFEGTSVAPQDLCDLMNETSISDLSDKRIFIGDDIRIVYGAPCFLVHLSEMGYDFPLNEFATVKELRDLYRKVINEIDCQDERSPMLRYHLAAKDMLLEIASVHHFSLL